MNEPPYLQHCLQIIEQKTGWGSAAHWTHQDFIRLSDQILEATGIHLSHTTLKRVWGKVKYNSHPHSTTLDALARYAGYADWRSWVVTHTQEPPAVPVAHQPAAREYYDRRQITRAAVVLLLLLTGMATLLGAIFATYYTNKTVAVKATDYTFAAQPMATGLPNTVLFHYNATAAGTDSIFIRPSADRPPEQVATDAQQHTALYYYPGVYKTELRVGDQTVQSQEVLIKTQGWLALAERQPVPFYFPENTVRQGALRISEERLEKYFPHMLPMPPWIAYYHVGHFGTLCSDDFVMETELKNTFGQGEAVCQDSSVVILRRQAPPITIPLAITGCLANVDRTLKNGLGRRGTIRLQAFGCDFSDWVPVKCEARDQRFRLWINQQLAYERTWQEDSQIVGIVYRFHGNGAVNSLRIGPATGPVLLTEDFSG